MSLILCGPPFCGKSHFGLRTARHLNCKFVDSDRLIEERHSFQTGTQLSCREIHRQDGDAVFRKKEKEAILSLMHTKQVVIAVGGGTLLDAESGSILKTMGPLVFLKTDFPVLWGRLKNKSELPSYIDSRRPEESFESIVAMRNAVCARYADITVETEKYSEAELIELLAKYLNSRGKHGE